MGADKRLQLLARRELREREAAKRQHAAKKLGLSGRSRFRIDDLNAISIVHLRPLAGYVVEGYSGLCRRGHLFAKDAAESGVTNGRSILSVELLGRYPAFTLFDELDPIEGILPGAWLLSWGSFVLGLLLLILLFCLAYVAPPGVSRES